MEKQKGLIVKENIPNFITVARVILFWFAIAGLALTYRNNEALHVGFFIFCVFLYQLDWLDGYIARKFGWESKVGEIIDPAGDKICAFCMLAYFYAIGIFPLWVLSIILFRDVVLSTLRLVSEKKKLFFKTSKMGKLRTNIIGFGGGIIYFLHYWGEIQYIKIGVIHLFIYAILIIVILNLGFLPNKLLLRMFPSFTDKLGALVTFIIVAIKPPYGIKIAMVWITVYTLWDYGKAFKVTVEDSKTRINLPIFLRKSVYHLALAVFLTAAVVVSLLFSFIGAILLANIVFICLLWRNAIYIQEQPQPQTSSTTSSSGTAKQTAT